MRIVNVDAHVARTKQPPSGSKNNYRKTSLKRYLLARLFDECFTIQKTFSQVLEPGEEWEIDYTHMTGPGIRLSHLITQGDSFAWDEDGAAFYYPIFEMVGVPVECYDSENVDNSYIGTSSGSIQIEMRKQCEIVQSQSNPSNLFETQDGFEDKRWAYRVYTDSAMSSATGSLNRRFNVPYVDIQKVGNSAAPNKYVIPITTNQQVTRGGYTNIPS